MAVPARPRPARLTAPTAVLEVLARGAAVGDEEDLDLLQHSLQCAALLRGQAPDDLELQVAGLVHDLGSVLAPRRPATHAATGAAAVVGLLGRDVAWLVASHAEAKRHLVTVDPDYVAGLSARSVATLRAQGGRVPPSVVAARAHAPAWDRALALRRADDRAKVADRVVPGLDSWVAPLEAVAVRNAGTDPYNLGVRRGSPGGRPARPIRSPRSTMTLAVGADAPDFTLKDQDGNEVHLADSRGRQPVVLVFYPFTFTGVCEGELCSLRDNPAMFERARARLYAISCDSRFAQQQWASQQGFEFPVLSDFWPHGEVARAYGVFNEALGCANRATFVIDRGGKVAAVFESPDLGTARDLSDYDAALSAVA